MSYNLSIPQQDCTLATCPISEGQQTYDPSLAGNALYLAIFALLLVFQVLLGIRYRVWGFLFAMVCGLVLEIIGYLGRLQMHFNPFASNPFTTYLTCLTIAPVFFSAAVYLCLARLVVVYGEHLSRFRPRTYTITFCCFDFISLCLQGAGGGIASTATTNSGSQAGINLFIAGLSFQVASLVLFIILCGEYAWRVRQRSNEMDLKYADLRCTRRFRLFIHALVLSTVCILIRSCFRVAELSEGLSGSLFNNQISFMILDGAMMIVAIGALVVLHPGFAFAGAWRDANFNLRIKKVRVTDNGMENK